MSTKVIAHRGASHLAKHENTLDSFKAVVSLDDKHRPDMVEFDVRETKDGVLIVFHDSTFHEVPIAWQSYADINKKAREEKFEVPTLEEVLKVCAGKIFMDIEIKEAGYEKKVVSTLRSICTYKDYSVKSFNDKVVYRIKKLDPHIRTGLLIGYEHNTLDGRISEIFPEKRLKKCKADFVSPYFRFVNPFYIRKMKKLGYEILTWTVNDEKIMKKMLKYKVPGIITDKPEVCMKLRRKIR